MGLIRHQSRVMSCVMGDGRAYDGTRDVLCILDAPGRVFSTRNPSLQATQKHLVGQKLGSHTEEV